MNKIKLDSSELFDSVRWQEDREEKRQGRREFHDVKASAGIQNRNARRRRAQHQQFTQKTAADDRYPRKFNYVSNSLPKQAVVRRVSSRQDSQTVHVSHISQHKQIENNKPIVSHKKISLARAVIVTALRAVKDPRPYRKNIKKKAIVMFADRTRNFRLAMSTMMALLVMVVLFNMFVVEDKPLVLGSTYSLIGPIPKEPLFDSKLATLQHGTRVFYDEDTVASYTVKDDEGRYLIIPKDNILTRIFRAGTDSVGSVTVPGSIQDVIWYDGSASFNENRGAALIVGHANGLKDQGVFSNIKFTKLKDKLEVIRGDSVSLKFEVREILRTEVGKVDMRSALLPTVPEEFGLNLLTCDGLQEAATQDTPNCYLIKATQIK